MRLSTCLILIVALFLAACGGSPSPTAVLPTVDNSASASSGDETKEPATPVGQVATPDFGATQSAEPTDQLQQRAYETDEAPLPLPGTMIAPTTPDPEAGLIFDTILFERTGGIAGIPLTIEIRSDGTITRDGVPSTISPDQVTLIDSVLDQLNFFGLQGVFQSPGTSADTYHYAVTVNRAGASRTLKAEDGFLPPELAQFLSLLSSLGAPTQ